MMCKRLVQVAIPSPLYRRFDYEWREAFEVVPGTRVSVPFGPRRSIGIVLAEITESAVPASKLRAVSRVLDREPVLPADLLELLEWASRYYHHPLGEVLASAIPVLLRKGGKAVLDERETWRLTATAADGPMPRRGAVVQQALLARLRETPAIPLDAAGLSAISPRWRTAMNALVERGLVQLETESPVPFSEGLEQPPTLLAEQASAVAQVNDALGRFQPFLLHGVTGSGKTEVYLQLLFEARRRGEQALVLVPEISLTPQLMQRFERRLSGCLVSLHSGQNDTERLQNWLLVANGQADVVIGTRSAVLTPIPRLGLIIVDEEHDGSLKQQDGFRYHARDLAVVRARNATCPVVLGTATPSFETLHNVAEGRFVELPLTRRAGDASPPSLSLLDIRRRPLIEGMSDRLLEAIRQHTAAGGQALVFINRRGFAPTLLCNDCGAAANCLRCDANMTVHLSKNRLRCHHCGSERPMPPGCESCGSTSLDRVGHGTERIASALAIEFPDLSIVRIDRDSTRRKGELERRLDLAATGEAQLLVGTQMLAKGHHFPSLTLVGVLDADRGLFGTDFRSLEHMGQLIIQVAGRAGRETTAGQVLIQTRNPDHPMLQTLVQEGYARFAATGLSERRQIPLPPFAFVALVRAEAIRNEEALSLLTAVAHQLDAFKLPGLVVLGPAPAPMERLGGRYRAQLLLQSPRRSTLNDALRGLTGVIGDFPGIRRVRWSIDVDPVDLF